MMEYDEEKQHSKQVEHLMTTVIACRSMLKYNLPLSDEQKYDLLNDIDTALDILRVFLAPAPPPISAPIPIPFPSPSAPRAISQSHCVPTVPLKEDTCPYESVIPSGDHERHTLDALYRMYHS